jgi:hypothetical protein
MFHGQCLETKDMAGGVAYGAGLLRAPYRQRPYLEQLAPPRKQRFGLNRCLEDIGTEEKEGADLTEKSHRHSTVKVYGVGSSRRAFLFLVDQQEYQEPCEQTR